MRELTDVAMVGVRPTDPEELLTHAAAAYGIARTGGSGIIRRSLAGLQTHLKPFTADARIRELDDQIISLTGRPRRPPAKENRCAGRDRRQDVRPLERDARMGAEERRRRLRAGDGRRYLRSRMTRPALIAVGGFPGTGKSVLATQLSIDLSIPRLCSDTFGATIRRVLSDHIRGGDAFRAGYEVLFELCEELLACHCSVITDMSMGWGFQWQRMDDIRGRIPVTFLPLILRCPYDLCIERIGRRHQEHPDDYPPADRFMRQPQLPQLWQYLHDLDRPEVRFIDASQDPTGVHHTALQYLENALRPTRGSADEPHH